MWYIEYRKKEPPQSRRQNFFEAFPFFWCSPPSAGTFFRGFCVHVNTRPLSFFLPFYSLHVQLARRAGKLSPPFRKRFSSPAPG